MIGSNSSAWSQVDKLFADQFENDGAEFIHRKSQKGEGYKVTAEARDCFIAEFALRSRWAIWLFAAGIILLIGALGLSIYRGAEVSRLAMFAGIGIAIVPYIAYFQWAWAAPARALANRVPVAPKRTPEEVQRLLFQNLSYGQLAGVAFFGTVLPFIGDPDRADFSGWNCIWLVAGGAFVLLAAVQAFRKWRFERSDFGARRSAPTDAGVSRNRPLLLPYLPLIALFAGLAFIAFTPAGKQLAQSQAFWAVLLIACGAWALFSVVRAFPRREIEPFISGFHDIYNRDTQPKRFWASMIWNTFIGIACIYFALQVNRGNEHEMDVEHCYDVRGSYSQSEVATACDRLFQKSTAALRHNPADAHAYYNRGFVHLKRGNLEPAIADFSQVIRLDPDSVGAYFYRWSAYKDQGDDARAQADEEALARFNPEAAEKLRENGWDPIGWLRSAPSCALPVR